MFILTWDQIEEFRSGRSVSLQKLQLMYRIYRKLFEPTYFPDGRVLQIFDKYFGKFDDRDPGEVIRLWW